MQSFKHYLTEKVLSPGLNPEHEHHREKHRQEIHDLLHKAYKPIGGYAGHESGSDEESKAIHHDISHSVIKMTKREGKVSAVNLYRKQHGRKSIASATDGTERGKRDFLKTKLEDHEQKRAWGEVSGAVEHIQRKIGVPVVHNKHAGRLTGKETKPDENGEHYTRKIGGHDHRKVIMGHPKEE